MAVPGRIGVLRRRLWNYPRAQRPRLFSVCRLCRVPAYLQIHAAGACKAGVQESLRHLHQERQTLAAYVFAHDAQPLGSASGLGLAEHRCIKLRLRRNDRECYMCSSVPRQYSWIVQLYSFETSNIELVRVVLVRVRPTKKAMTEPRRRSTVSVCTVRCESQNNTTIVLFVARRIRSRTSSRQTLVLILL